MPLQKLLCWHKNQFYWMQIIFLSGTKCLWLPQYVNKFLVWHKKFGPAQNILGPVKGQGIRLHSSGQFALFACYVYEPAIVISWLFYWWFKIQNPCHYALSDIAKTCNISCQLDLIHFFYSYHAAHFADLRQFVIWILTYLHIFFEFWSVFKICTSIFWIRAQYILQKKGFCQFTLGEK